MIKQFSKIIFLKSTVKEIKVSLKSVNFYRRLASSYKMTTYKYPAIRRDPAVVEDFHGVKVNDPYRWLEDPDSDETKAFVDAENLVTNQFLNQCKYRSKIRERITELWNYEKYSCPFKRGDHYYFFKNTGLQNQSVVYKQKTLGGEATEFLDPNKLSEDGTTALRSYTFSEDAKTFAYMISEKGSDWSKIKFRDVETGKDLDEVLENVKFSCLDWSFDNKGVFYNQYLPATGADGTKIEKNEFQKLYYHRIGTQQSDDILIAEFPTEPNWMGHGVVTHCGDYLLMVISKSCDPTNQLWYCNLKAINHEIKGPLSFTKLIDNFDSKYDYVTNEGSLFTFKTNLNAQNYKLIKIDVNNPDKSKWIELIPEAKDVLQDVNCVNKNKLLVNYLHDCKDELYLYDLAMGHQLYKFDLPIGSILEIACKYDQDFFFYKFGSFTSPGDIYYCSLAIDSTFEPKLHSRSAFKGLDLGEFKTEQVFYESKDGTKVPMFLVCKKNLERSDKNPVILYGYGGFNISLTPSFSITRLIWLKHFNGIYVCANIRGGGEYGEAWYNAGRLFNKQNVFDDFISAAEYLVANKYTSKERLMINGGSNGGLLVTACINQRPDLFHAAIADVSVCDMLRFHKFTIGSYWTSDYGCADKEAEFKYLMTYSPIHNVKENQKYPHVLMVTADHDDRVVPSHSYKYIAELQHKNGNVDNQSLLLIRIETKAGHGAGKPTSKIIEEHADKFAFASDVMNLEWQD